MSESRTINALRSALEPVEALRGEHSQMEQWVRESFASLEHLHEELNERESILSRREAVLSQHASDLGDGPESSAAEQTSALEAEIEQIRQQLKEANARSQELETEIAEQLDAMEQVDRAATEMRAELTAGKAQIEELQSALAEEREQASQQQGGVASELNDVRHALERQRQTLDDLLEAVALSPTFGGGADAAGSESYADATARLAEIRQRAQARHATKSRDA